MAIIWMFTIYDFTHELLNSTFLWVEEILRYDQINEISMKAKKQYFSFLHSQLINTLKSGSGWVVLRGISNMLEWNPYMLRLNWDPLITELSYSWGLKGFWKYWSQYVSIIDNNTNMYNRSRQKKKEKENNIINVKVIIFLYIIT